MKVARVVCRKKSMRKHEKENAGLSRTLSSIGVGLGGFGVSLRPFARPRAGPGRRPGCGGGGGGGGSLDFGSRSGRGSLLGGFAAAAT